LTPLVVGSSIGAMARGGRRLRRRATVPAGGLNNTIQANQPVACVTVAPASAPHEADVLKAVASLYKDGLKPFSRILRKRLVEHAQETQAKLLDEDGGNTVKESDVDTLRTLCEASPQLRVEIEDWGEWSAFLVDREPNFIDIYDPVDNYPQELWTAAENYFKSLDVALAGGRYVSARALSQCGLPFFEGYSLGQLCHIMQLAISQRKLLGYFNGAIVPCERSTSTIKCRCAQQQRPLVEEPVSVRPDGAIHFQIVDLGTARLKLREILDSALLRGAKQVPLSNIKRLFRSLYQMELSETALGHSKLTHLLQDPRFNDICTVQLQDGGNAVVPVYLDHKTSLNDDGVALCTNISQVTPRKDAEEQERLHASNGISQQQDDCVWQPPVRVKVVPPVMRAPSQPRMIRRACTTANEFGVEKEVSDEHVNSLVGGFSHRSIADSKCSTDSGSLRGFSRTDSGISEGNQSVSPQRGAGAELRARLRCRLFKAEGRV